MSEVAPAQAGASHAKEESGRQVHETRISPLDAAVGRSRVARYASVGLAAGLHGVLAIGGVAAMPERESAPREPARVTHMFEVDLAPESAPELPAEVVEPEPVIEPPPKAVRRAPKAPAMPAGQVEPDAAPPQAEPNRPAEAAQAAELLTATEPDVVDFGNTMVVGDAKAYAGGTTASRGTATQAVRDPHARADGIPEGTGKAVSGPDLSRPPQLAGGVTWRDCGFPRAAVAMGITQATVTLHLTIESSGKVSNARVVEDPGHGLGAHAAECARHKRWHPASGRDGQPIRWSHPLRVQFVR